MSARFWPSATTSLCRSATSRFAISTFYRPADDSAELAYLRSRRQALGGYLPARRRSAPAVAAPALETYADFALHAEGKTMSTTVAVVRLIGNLLKDETLGPRIVPIVADEARTFGMANLFRQVGIYSSVGQLYEPEDASSMLYYKESKDGQLLEEGITEAGALSSWVAAATSYSVHGFAMLPVYIFYSMFGFQRVGDLIWAAADQRARGFLIGATAGRTTLAGEGLQHQDGSSHLLAATIPNCRAYDPAFAYEMAVILDHGVRSMMEEGKDEFYYITAMNENYNQPSMPEKAEAGIIKGLYLFASHGSKERSAVCPSARLGRDPSGSGSKRQRCWTPSGTSPPKSGARPVTPSLRGTHGRRTPQPTQSARGAGRQPPRRLPARRRAHHRSVRLCSRLPADDRRLCGRPVHCAWHGRFWPQRHPASAPRLLRSRPISHRDRRPRCAREGASWHDKSWPTPSTAMA